MSDLISRSAAMNFLLGLTPLADKHECARALADLPAVDAMPVVHARWIYSGEMDEDSNCEANCSACGAGDKHRPDLKNAVPYCWNCGARMDGEAE